MTAWDSLRRGPEFARLCTVSQQLGTDPLQVQGAGGNTSIKRDGAMWIKASGTWLAEAESRDIMVPVDAKALREAALAGDARAETGTAFVPEEVPAPDLRPSIETSVHAVLPAPCVLHTHCVTTIAAALRADAAEVVAQRLADLDVAFIPYVKPGLALARGIAARIGPDTRGLVLGNHGLVATGESVDTAADLLTAISARLAPATAPELPPDPALMARLDGSAYAPAESEALHAVARDPARLAIARAGSYYPDHVIFLGPGAAVAEPHEHAESAAARLAELRGSSPVLLFWPGLGAALRRDASAGARALARGLGDVLARVDPEAPRRTLTAEEEAALLGWEAEAYRQSLDRQPGNAAP